MHADRFIAVAEAYGADSRRWPACERGLAAGPAMTDATARIVLE